MTIRKTNINPGDISKDMRRLRALYPTIIKRALWDELSDIMAVSRIQCPHKTGRLRASGHVSDPTYSDGIARGTLGYSTDYAIYVHERLDLHHAPPTKAKYLEDPVNDAMDGGRFITNLMQRIDMAVLSALGGGL